MFALVWGWTLLGILTIAFDEDAYDYATTTVTAASIQRLGTLVVSLALEIPSENDVFVCA